MDVATMPFSEDGRRFKTDCMNCESSNQFPFPFKNEKVSECDVASTALLKMLYTFSAEVLWFRSVRYRIQNSRRYRRTVSNGKALVQER
jgi:hypothetical protein